MHSKKNLNPPFISINSHDRQWPTHGYQRITGDMNEGTRPSVGGTSGCFKPTHPLIPLHRCLLKDNRILEKNRPAIALKHALSIF
jgi:hypothetical protein